MRVSKVATLSPVSVAGKFFKKAVVTSDGLKPRVGEPIIKWVTPSKSA